MNVSLTQDEVHPWLSAINDIRLYHSAQYEEFKKELLEGDENSDQATAAQNYLDWLGYHQDSLLSAMMGE